MYYNFSFDQYICYEIEEGIVKVTSYNEPGGNRTVSIGSVGSVRNPKGELVTETSAYGRVRFGIKSIIKGRYKQTRYYYLFRCSNSTA